MFEPLRRCDEPVGIAITRVFDAPRERVWKEWTEASRFAGWFGGPGIVVPVTSVSIDLRPGGAWEATTLAFGRDGRDVRWHGRYLEIVTPERLEFTITTGVHPAEVATVLLSALGSRTEMVFRQRGNLSAAEYERVSNAWSLEFDCMTARLADGEASSAFMRPSGADPRGRT